MSPEFQRAMDEAEPKAERSPAPIIIIVFFTLMFYFGLVYLNDHGGGFNAKVYGPYASYKMVEEIQPVLAGPDPRKGKRIFEANCQVCHQPNGQGQPGQFPPLAGSDWVAAQSPTRIIRGVLNGLTGPITVSGKPFNNTMVPWKSILSDDDISSVLTFVRGNKEWGNSAPPVTAEQVAAIRKLVESRNAAFTPDELLKIPEGQ